MGERVTVRQTLLAVSSALDAASADLDRLALIAGDDPQAAEFGAIVVFRTLAELVTREAACLRR